MSSDMTATSDQWMQNFYQQPPLMDDGMFDHMEAFSDATVMTTDCTISTSYGHLTPKGNAFKPIRKRCRASKRTPTTLLNANTTNFRELVQQFTGCASTSSAMSSFATHKGPITLNFQQGSRGQSLQHSTRGTNSSPFGNRIYYYNQAHHHVQQQQSGYSLEHVKSVDSVPSVVNSRLSSMVVSDGLLVGNDDFGLHELIKVNNAFSNDMKNYGY